MKGNCSKVSGRRSQKGLTCCPILFVSILQLRTSCALQTFVAEASGLIASGNLVRPEVYARNARGENNCTMGNVLSRVKDTFPTPENQRPKLLLCDNVLERGIDELYSTIRAYLERYRHDYNGKTRKLQLHATLLFVEKTNTPLPGCVWTSEEDD